MNKNPQKSLLEENKAKLKKLAVYFANDEMSEEKYIAEVSKITNPNRVLFGRQEKIVKVNLKELLATSYRTYLSEKVQKAQSEMVDAGREIGTAPLGYLNIKCYGITSVEIIDEIAVNIRTLFTLFATGNYSLDDLCLLANKFGMVGKRTGKPLQRQDIKRILKNKFYCGYARFKGKEYKHIYQPIISVKLFNRCQQVGKEMYPKF